MIDANELMVAGYKAIKACPFKFQSQLFEKNQLIETAKLQEKIKDFNYTPGRTRDFILNERGKIREISAIQMRDKVVNHVLCDSIITPTIKPYLIYDNWASVECRGVSQARKRLKIHLQRYYDEYNTNKGYILLIDFKSYYKSIKHDISLPMMNNKIKADEITSYLLNQVYNSFNNGINIGNQVSQDIGILHSYQIDNYIKIIAGCKYYGRYTDDSYCICDTREKAQQILNAIMDIAKKLGIIIHPKKTRIIKLDQPFYFLKIKYQLLDDGRVKTNIHPQTIIREKRKIKKLHIYMLENKITQLDIDNCFKSWLGSYWKYMTALQIKDFADFYIKLYGRLPKWKKHSRLRYLMEHQLPQD